MDDSCVLFMRRVGSGESKPLGLGGVGDSLVLQCDHAALEQLLARAVGREVC